MWQKKFRTFSILLLIGLAEVEIFHFLLSRMTSWSSGYWCWLLSYNLAKYSCRRLCWNGATIRFIKFWEFLMFGQTFYSPQVKRNVIISNKHGINDLPYELPNDWIFSIFWILNIKRISKWPSAQSSSENENFLNTMKKNSWKTSRSTLFHMKTRLYLKYFVHHCIWKIFLLLTCPRSLSADNFGNSKVFNNFKLKLEQLIFKKC